VYKSFVFFSFLEEQLKEKTKTFVWSKLNCKLKNTERQYWNH